MAAPTAFLLIEQSGFAFFVVVGFWGFFFVFFFVSPELYCAGQWARSCEKRENNVIFFFDIFQHCVWEDFYVVRVLLLLGNINVEI